MASVSFDGTIISGAESGSDGGTWNEYGKTKTPSQEQDILYQGNYCQSVKVSATSFGLDFADGASLDYSTAPKRYTIVKVNITTTGLIDQTIANGLLYEIGSTRTAKYDYYLSGLYAGPYPAPKGGFLIIAIDPNETAFRDGQSGTPSLSAVTHYAIYATITGASKSENVMHDRLDEFALGSGLTITGAGGIFADFLAQDEGNISNRYGLFTTGQAERVVRGMLTFGSATSVQFSDANFVLAFPLDKVGQDTYGTEIDLQNSATVVNFEAGVFKSLGLAATKRFFDSALDVQGTGTPAAWDNTVCIPDHGYSTGDYVLYSDEGGTAVSGLTDNLNYFVRAVDQHHIAFYAVGSSAGRQNSLSDTSRISLTAAGTGENHSVKRAPDNRADHTVSGTSGSVTWINCQLDGVRVLTLTSACTLTGGAVLRTGNIIISTATISGVKFLTPTTEEGEALLTPVTSLANVDSCEFTAPATISVDMAAKVWVRDADVGWTDETTDFNDPDNADVQIFPSTETASDYFAVGYQRPFNKLILDNANGTAGVGGAVTWQYWNGAWTNLTGVADGTNGFTETASDGQTVTWTMPTDWVTTSLNSSVQLYYVRALADGNYTTTPVYDQGYVYADTPQGHAIEITATGSHNSDANLFNDYWNPANGGWQFHTQTGVDSNIITTNANHGFYSGDAVYYSDEGGSDTINLTDQSKYYVHVLSTTTFTVHVTRAAAIAGSSVITLADGSSGETHSFYGAHAAIFNDSGGPVTINVVNQGDAPSIRNGSGASTTVATAAVPVAVHAETADGTNIQNARVFLKAADGTGPFPFEATVTISNSGTTATVTHNSHGMATNDYVNIDLSASGSSKTHYQNDGVFQITVIDDNTYTYTMLSGPGSSPTGTIKATFVALVGLTDVSGDKSTTRSYASDQPVTGWIRLTPTYKTAPLGGTIDKDTGYSATGIMIPD